MSMSWARGQSMTWSFGAAPGMDGILPGMAHCERPTSTDKVAVGVKAFVEKLQKSLQTSIRTSARVYATSPPTRLSGLNARPKDLTLDSFVRAGSIGLSRTSSNGPEVNSAPRRQGANSSFLSRGSRRAPLGTDVKRHRSPWASNTLRPHSGRLPL